MSTSRALIAVAAPRVNRSTRNALVTSNDLPIQVVQNGPGMHLNLFFRSGGTYVEALARGIASLLKQGPDATVEAVELLFGYDATRMLLLDQLYHLRQSAASGSTEPAKYMDNAKTTLKLKKLCGKLLKYAQSSELPSTQLSAFKGIVLLTTRFIGVRKIFLERLSTRYHFEHPSQSDISELWREGSAGGDHEWDFFLEYAAYCLSAPDAITAILETMQPSRFGYFEAEGSLCISIHLLNCISTAPHANELLRLAAVRYLGGILELATFWDHRRKTDPHSLSDKVCLASIGLLEDLAADCEERGVTVFRSDLDEMDPEGIHMMMFATLQYLLRHLNTLPADDSRTASSHEIAVRFMQRLQTDRSWALFPAAAEQAKKLLSHAQQHVASTNDVDRLSQTTAERESKGDRERSDRARTEKETPTGPDSPLSEIQGSSYVQPALSSKGSTPRHPNTPSLVPDTLEQEVASTNDVDRISQATTEREVQGTGERDSKTSLHSEAAHAQEEAASTSGVDRSFPATNEEEVQGAEERGDETANGGENSGGFNYFLKPAWDISRLIWKSIQRVKESKRQFGCLAWTIAELLRVLNQGYIAGRLSDLSSTSFIIHNLQELLEEIHDFIEADINESFIKFLFTKERRTAQIDAYQKKIAVMANAFQMSALFDVAKWQEKNDAARVEDQKVLYSKLDGLERDRELLRKTLEAHQQSMVAMIITFQTRLEQHLDGDRERQFFSTSVKYLLTASDRRVEEHDWVVSPSDVQFMEPIASGGFCEILLGRWQGGEVALKILKTVNGITPSSMILQLEINVWSKLRHPHILPFLGANIWGDRPFIVMPYLKNGNARDYIQNYPECNRAAILHQASLGLVYLHSMNIVHADMKGHNILIDGGGKAVLCDFGLSRVKTDINSQSRDAGKEEIYGSINWMAPERLLGRSLRMPSDIYSFGMTIYEVFANDIPFADMHPLYFIQLVARENTRPEKPDADDNFTPEIWALAGRCWAHTPSDRPSAKEVSDALEHIIT